LPGQKENQQDFRPSRVVHHCSTPMQRFILTIFWPTKICSLRKIQLPSWRHIFTHWRPHAEKLLGGELMWFWTVWFMNVVDRLFLRVIKLWTCICSDGRQLCDSQVIKAPHLYTITNRKLECHSSISQARCYWEHKYNYKSELPLSFFSHTAREEVTVLLITGARRQSLEHRGGDDSYHDSLFFLQVLINPSHLQQTLVLHTIIWPFLLFSSSELTKMSLPVAVLF
jgi:hypothetical protein